MSAEPEPEPEPTSRACSACGCTGIRILSADYETIVNGTSCRLQNITTCLCLACGNEFETHEQNVRNTSIYRKAVESVDFR